MHGGGRTYFYFLYSEKSPVCRSFGECDDRLAPQSVSFIDKKSSSKFMVREDLFQYVSHPLFLPAQVSRLFRFAHGLLPKSVDENVEGSVHIPFGCVNSFSALLSHNSEFGGLVFRMMKVSFLLFGCLAISDDSLKTKLGQFVQQQTGKVRAFFRSKNAIERIGFFIFVFEVQEIQEKMEMMKADLDAELVHAESLSSKGI